MSSFINLTGNNNRAGKRPIQEIVELLTSNNNDTRPNRRPRRNNNNNNERRAGKRLLQEIIELLTSNNNNNTNITRPARRPRRNNNQPGPSRPRRANSSSLLSNTSTRPRPRPTNRNRPPPPWLECARPPYRAVSRGGGWLRNAFGPLRLKPHQLAVSRLLASPDVPGLLLFYKVGSGKTLAAIAAAENLAHFEGRWRCVVVVVPASLRNNFRKELAASQPTHPDLFKVVSFNEVHALTSDERHRLGRDAVLVVDEAHTLRNPVNKPPHKRTMLDSVMEVAQASHKRLLLSGTPIVNYPYEVGSMLALIHPPSSRRVLKEWAEKNGQMVAEATFVQHFGKFAEKDKPGLDALLRCSVLFYEPGAANLAHYPGMVQRWEEVPMTPRQAMSQFEIAAKQPLLTLRQLLQGLDDYDDDAQTRSTRFLTQVRTLSLEPPSPKLLLVADRVAAEVRGNGGKCVVYSSFTRAGGLQALLTMLTARGVRAELYDGQVSQDKRKDIIQRYNNGSTRALLISDAGKEGLDLKETTQLHVLEPQWNEEKVNQVIGRAIRYKSHANSRAVVRVIRYCSVLPRQAREAVPQNNRNRHVLYTMTADQILRQLSEKKHEKNQEFLERLKRIAQHNLTTCIASYV